MSLQTHLKDNYTVGFFFTEHLPIESLDETKIIFKVKVTASSLLKKELSSCVSGNDLEPFSIRFL